jgi:protein SCO1/2
MNFKFSYYWLLALIPIVFIGWYFKSTQEIQAPRLLPYYGQRHTVKINDTGYHQVPNFEFINQFGEKVTEQTIRNKIYISEYFFTTCQSICPIMNANLDKVYAAFRDDPDFLILSHTVDPEVDSIPVLLDYAKKHGVKDKKWLFLTGEKKSLYELARKGYLLNDESGDGGIEDFIHTQNFALIDKERHIRGFYAGTDSLEIVRLIQEINLLKMEYAYKAARN